MFDVRKRVPRVADGARRAIKFVRAQVDVLPGEQCQALVQIESLDSGVVTATAQGGSSQADQLRAVARATSDALGEAFEAQGASVRVRSVQLVETITQTVVLVSLAASKETRTQSLLGVSDGTNDPAAATALAVLNATNRFLGRE